MKRRSNITRNTKYECTYTNTNIQIQIQLKIQNTTINTETNTGNGNDASLKRNNCHLIWSVIGVHETQK